MAVKYTNNAKSTLAADIAAGATALSVAAGDGAKFPAISGSDYFYVTLQNGSTTRVVKVTARAGDVFTFVATDTGFPSGSRVELRVCKELIDDLPNGELRSIQVYATAGVHTWNKPAGLKRVRVRGRASGGAGAKTTGSAGGGGGQGGYFEKVIEAADLGATESVTIGEPGAAVTVTALGNAGGSVSFGSHASATGGSGGGTTGGGAGGTAVGGDINIRGANGGDGIIRSNGSTPSGGIGGGEGGGGGGTTASGGDGVMGGGGGGTATGTTSGAGGIGWVVVEEFF